MRRIEGRIMSVVNGETIVRVAKSKSARKRKETIHKVMKLFSIPTQANEGMKTKVNILGFYTMIF